MWLSRGRTLSTPQRTLYHIPCYLRAFVYVDNGHTCIVAVSCLALALPFPLRFYCWLLLRSLLVLLCCCLLLTLLLPLLQWQLFLLVPVIVYMH